MVQKKIGIRLPGPSLHPFVIDNKTNHLSILIYPPSSFFPSFPIHLFDLLRNRHQFPNQHCHHYQQHLVPFLFSIENSNYWNYKTIAKFDLIISN